jgi:hypothetical protein
LSEWYKFEEVGLEEFATTSENYEIHITNKDNKTYGVMKSNGDIIKRVETVKHPLDEFDFKVASEVVMDRLLDREKKEDKTLEVKEVKRKANVGEWVKIVNASYIPKTDGVQDYKNGSILQIIESDNFDGQNNVRYGIGISNDGSEKILFQDEYVVLENYNPNIETKTTSKQLSDYTNEELLAEIERRLK